MEIGINIQLTMKHFGEATLWVKDCGLHIQKYQYDNFYALVNVM